MEYKELSNEWVDDRLAVLTPDWRPDSVRARARLNAKTARRATPRGFRLAALLATCAVCLAFVAWPGARAIAQQMWDRLFLSGVTVVRLDPSRLPWSLSVHIGQNSEVRAESAEVAARSAGFTPVFPPEFGRPPELSVIGPIVASVNLKTQELQEALERAGVADVRAPQQWDGVKLGIEIRPIVVASYADDTTLMQLQPFSLSAPAGFAMKEFVEVAFRILGLGTREARQMAAQFAEHPTWFLGVPQEDAVSIREVTLQSGPGMLIEDFKDDGGSERTALLWSSSDRTFVLTGNMSPDRAVAIANTIPATR